MTASPLLLSVQERPFLLSAALAGAIGAGAYGFGDTEWAARFSSTAVCATMSWYASAVVLRSISVGRKWPIVWAAGLKVAALAAMIMGLRTLGAEPSSFLLALNLYLAAAAACIALDAVARRIRESGAVASVASPNLETPATTHA